MDHDLLQFKQHKSIAQGKRFFQPFGVHLVWPTTRADNALKSSIARQVSNEATSVIIFLEGATFPQSLTGIISHPFRDALPISPAAPISQRRPNCQ
jgi:hypothetical protein